jgi:L-asparaginase
MTPAQWDEILRAIERNYDKYDGFLITHGTDTMAYTAAALSVAIKNLGKPIVLTGSQIPSTELETDARRNLVNAMKVATMDVSGVFVVFDQRVILRSRASKASESRLDAFTSVNGRDAGEIRIGITLDPSLSGRKTDTIAVQPGFEPDIVVYTLTPGCDPRDLSFLLQNERIKGLIIRAYGAAPRHTTSGRSWSRPAAKRLPVVVTSQCLHWVTTMSGYDVGGSALERGAIEGYGQSLRCWR